MQSDFLDVSNTDRLKAFFMFVDVANMARSGIQELDIESPQLKVCAVALIESQRQVALQRAIELFDPYILPSVTYT